MPEERYYVIHNGEGDTHVSEHTKEDLLEKLEEDYWGTFQPRRGPMRSIPSDPDTHSWGGRLLIIKGYVVAPTEKRVVTELDIA